MLDGESRAVQGALSQELEGSRSQLVGVLTRASSPRAELSLQAVTALPGPSEPSAHAGKILAEADVTAPDPSVLPTDSRYGPWGSADHLVFQGMGLQEDLHCPSPAKYHPAHCSTPTRTHWAGQGEAEGSQGKMPHPLRH